MNKTEACEVLDLLRVMFPDWFAWLSGLPTKAETLRLYTTSLETQEIEHVRKVITDWQTGKQKLPESYQRERLVFILVSAARELRSQDTRRETAQTNLKTWHQEAAEAQRRRQGYKPAIDRPMGNAMRQIKVAADSVATPKSQWSEAEIAEYFRHVDEICEVYAKSLDRA